MVFRKCGAVAYFSWKIVVGFDAIWNKKWTLSSYFLTSPSNFLYCLENMGPLAFL